MRAAARVARLETGLEASDAILAWLDEALRFDDAATYVTALLASEPPERPFDRILDTLARRIAREGTALAARRDRYRREAWRARVLYNLVRELQARDPKARYHELAHLRLRLSAMGSSSARESDAAELARMCDLWLPAAVAALEGWRLDRAVRGEIQARYLGGRDVRFVATRRQDRVTRTEARLLEQGVADCAPEGPQLLESAGPDLVTLTAEVDRYVYKARLEAAEWAGRADLVTELTRRLMPQPADPSTEG